MGSEMCIRDSVGAGVGVVVVAVVALLDAVVDLAVAADIEGAVGPVSYTHLTLPTSDLV